MAEKSRQMVNAQSGCASHNGFEIQVLDNAGVNKTVESLNYKNEDYSLRYSAIIVFWPALAVLAFYNFILFYVLNHDSALIQYFGLLVAIWSAIHFYSLLFIACDHQSKEWHGCEHKVVNLLCGNKAITLENLRQTSRVHRGCGTHSGCVWIFLFIYYAAVSIVYNFMAMGLANHQTFGPIFDYFWWWLFGVLFLLPFPIYGILIYLVVSPLVQYFITTAESSEEKLREALEVAEKAYNIAADGGGTKNEIH